MTLSLTSVAAEWLPHAPCLRNLPGASSAIEDSKACRVALPPFSVNCDLPGPDLERSRIVGTVRRSATLFGDRMAVVASTAELFSLAAAEFELLTYAVRRGGDEWATAITCPGRIFCKESDQLGEQIEARATAFASDDLRGGDLDLDWISREGHRRLRLRLIESHGSTSLSGTQRGRVVLRVARLEGAGGHQLVSSERSDSIGALSVGTLVHAAIPVHAIADQASEAAALLLGARCLDSLTASLREDIAIGLSSIADPASDPHARLSEMLARRLSLGVPLVELLRSLSLDASLLTDPLGLTTKASHALDDYANVERLADSVCLLACTSGVNQLLKRNELKTERTPAAS